nr:hypothetical protein [Desertimonas flava]
MAVAVGDRHGLARRALSVSGPSTRLLDDDAERIAATLLERAGRLGMSVT